MLKNYKICSSTWRAMSSPGGLVAGIVLFSVLLFVSNGVYAENTESLFASGNSKYEQGDYAGAIADYEKARLTGKVSAALYYNLAGAYFKYSDVGRAVLNYERARELSPRDADITANYALSKSLVRGNEPPLKGFLAWRPVRAYFSLLTVSEMTIITSALFFLFFIFLALAAVSESFRARSVFILFVILIFLIFSSTFVFLKVKDRDSRAVTIADSSNALYGPFDSATKFFTLYEGNIINILESKGDWDRVRRSDGMIGWVKNEDIERI